jgi:hypothetical protein
MLGMQGANLAEKRRKEILARAPKIPLEQIKEIDQSHFEVQSTSSENTYEVNLLTYACMCSNFPCIQLCKHIAATMHFFFGGGVGPWAPVNESASEQEPDVPKSPAQQDGSISNTRTHASVISAANDIVRTAQEILVMAPVDLATAKSLQMARSQLNAVLLSVKDNRSQLPEKEQITLNQLSWPSTAACMGVKRGEKRRRSKVDSALIVEHIGVPKRKRTNDDPYGAGEQSGKRTKPDAVSTAANARAQAAAERPLLASLPTRLPPSPAPYAQTHPIPMHAPAMYSPVHFPVPPIPYSQPTYVQYSSSQPAPSLYPPMYSPYYTFPPPA